MKKEFITFGEHNGVHRTKHFKTTLKVKKLIEGYINTLGDECGDVHNEMFFNNEWVTVFNEWLKDNDFNFQLSSEKIYKILFHPDFQRNYVVGGKEFLEWRLDLWETVVNNEPINPISLGFIVDEKGNFTGNTIVVIDGQQRLITICDYAAGIQNVFYSFYYDGKLNKDIPFDLLPIDFQEKILNYTFDINICVGTEEAIHRYFEKINKPTFVLNEMELICSSYCNEFTENAKHLFCLPSSRSPKHSMFLDPNSIYCVDKYGSELTLKTEDKTLVRMQSLRKAEDWASFCESCDNNGYEVAIKQNEFDRIKIYNTNHKRDKDASNLTNAVKEVIDFFRDVCCHNLNDEKIFKSRSNKDLIKGFDGKVGISKFYEKYKNKILTDNQKDNITQRAWNLIEEPSSHSGWHDMPYIFEWSVIVELEGEKAGEEFVKKIGALRKFEEGTKKKTYNSCGGICPIDGKKYSFEELEFHHIVSRFKGGSSEEQNCFPMTPDMHDQFHNCGGNINGKHYTQNDLFQLKFKTQNEVIQKQCENN